MKIYYIVSSLNGGGAEFAIPELVDFFVKAGNDIEIFSSIPRSMETAALLNKHHITYHLLSGNEENRYKSTYNFYKIVKENPPDLIWTSLTRGTIDGQIAGWLNHVPVVSWRHSANTNPIRLFKTKWMRKLSQLWVADSRGVDYFLQSKMGIPPDRVMIWPLFQVPRHLPCVPEWNGKGIFHIGSMGRLHPVKNFDLMIRAVAYINQHYPEVGKRIQLSIAGTGNERQHLQNLISALGVENVKLVGFYENVMEYLPKLHLYLQTSVYEGLCISVHEALAVGLPVISTNVGEMQFAINKNPIGTILYENSPEALAKEILDYFHNPDKTRHYGMNARRYVEKLYSHECFEQAGQAILTHIETKILPNFQKVS